MSGVTYYQLGQSTTSVPDVDAATGTFIDGFYGVNGTLEYLIMRINVTATTGTAAWETDLSALLTQFKLVINGDILIDWNQGFNYQAGTALPGRFGYFINSIGGRSLQTATAAAATTADCWIAIPVGSVLSGPTPRFEITTAFQDMNDICGASVTASTTSVTWWARFNPNTQRSTRVISATSFDHGSALNQQVVARVPTIPGGFTLEMISIANASDDDDGYGTDGLRILGLSQFSMPISMQRWASNELGNGVMAMLPASDANAQSYRTEMPGLLNIPLYGMKAGDLTMIVNNGANTDTRLYTPVLTAPLRGVGQPAPRQTVAAIGNTQKSIVARTEGDN